MGSSGNERLENPEACPFFRDLREHLGRYTTSNDRGRERIRSGKLERVAEA
jgi:hypothetical protein